MTSFFQGKRHRACIAGDSQHRDGFSKRRCRSRGTLGFGEDHSSLDRFSALPSSCDFGMTSVAGPVAQWIIAVTCALAAPQRSILFIGHCQGLFIRNLPSTAQSSLWLGKAVN